MIFFRYITRLIRLSGVLLLSGPLAAQVPGPQAFVAPAPQAAEWDINMLKSVGAANGLDLSRFKLGNPVLPGTYRADVFLNNQWLGRRNVRLVSVADKPLAPAVPCIDKPLFDLLGIDPQKLLTAAHLQMSQVEPNHCWVMESLVGDSSVQYDPSEQVLNIFIAQANLKRQARGYVPPEMWTQGVNAGTLGYQFNEFYTRSASAGVEQANSAIYLGLNGGVNFGAWHLREQGALLSGTGQKTQFQQSQVYLGRDLPDIQSQLMVGNTFSDGQLLNSFSVVGATLASDERMYPDSERGFAPAIHGVALTNAKVQIRQNNIVIYDTVVPPGPFNITDLYPTGFGGDLVVTVTESDGTARSFNVPFSAAPMSLREGRLRYSLVGGRLTNLPVSGDKYVVEGNLQYGLNNTWTLNAALLAASGYAAALVGTAVNTEVGSVVANLTSAQFNLPNAGSLHGNSVNLAWSKLFTPINTNFSFAAYRYSSANYYNLQDAMASLARLETAPTRQRQQMLVNVSQNLGRYGSLNFSGNTTNFWANPSLAYQPGNQTGYSLGYGFNTHGMALTLSATRTYSSVPGTPVDNTIGLGLNIPLTFGERNFSVLNGQVSHDNLSGSTEQVSWSGTFGHLNEFGLGLSESHTRNVASTNNGASSTTMVNGTYRAPLALLNATAGSSSNGNQGSLSASGGLVVHAGGITFSPLMGDTMALVHVEDGEGIRVANFPSAPLDGQGYTLLPFLTPYQQNTVSLDLSQVSLQTHVENAYAQVAPHAGAVALLNFTKAQGLSVFINVKMDDGKPAPFGANVLDGSGEQVGSVGQFGRIEARVKEATGQLAVVWGEGVSQRCLLHYAVTSVRKDVIQTITATCQITRPEAPTRLGQANSDKDEEGKP